MAASMRPCPPSAVPGVYRCLSSNERATLVFGTFLIDSNNPRRKPLVNICNYSTKTGLNRLESAQDKFTTRVVHTSNFASRCLNYSLLVSRINFHTEQVHCILHYSKRTFSTYGVLSKSEINSSKVTQNQQCKDSQRRADSDQQAESESENDKSEVRQNTKIPSEGVKENIYTIPNFLTVSRMVLSPVLGYMVLQGYYSYACGIFMYAALTDLFDGYIARNWPGQQSSLGSFLDPAADKLLMGVLTVSLTWVELLPIPLAALILSRDVLLMAGASVIKYRSLPPPRSISKCFKLSQATTTLQPTCISKVNTAVQLSLVCLTLAAPVLHFVNHPTLQALWYVTGATTIISGCSYLLSKNTYKILTETEDQSSNSKIRKDDKGKHVN